MSCVYIALDMVERIQTLSTLSLSEPNRGRAHVSLLSFNTGKAVTAGHERLSYNWATMSQWIFWLAATLFTNQCRWPRALTAPTTIRVDLSEY